jgi:hypothetical protein
MAVQPLVAVLNRACCPVEGVERRRLCAEYVTENVIAASFRLMEKLLSKL